MAKPWLMKSLWTLMVGRKATISSISENLDAKYRQRLLDLGLHEGAEIVCVRKTPFGGPKVFLVRESLFSFDREISESILISDVLAGANA